MPLFGNGEKHSLRLGKERERVVVVVDRDIGCLLRNELVHLFSPPCLVCEMKLVDFIITLLFKLDDKALFSSRSFFVCI